MWALKTLGLLTLSVLFVIYCVSRAADQSRRDGVTMENNTLHRVVEGPLGLVWWISIALIAVPAGIAYFS